MGGTRANSGGVRRGAGRKPKALAAPDESGRLLTRVEVGKRLLVELPEGTIACANPDCRRVLPSRRFMVPAGRGRWLPNAYCDSCRRRHRNQLQKEARDVEGRPREGRARWTASGPPPPLGGTAGADRNRSESQGTTADSHSNQQLGVCDLGALAAALTPVIGRWPSYDAFSSALRRAVGRQVEREGIDATIPGRQPGVQAIARSRGRVQVLEVPDYIQADFIHALPEPECSRHLGDAARLRAVAVSEAPPPGHAWYVVVKVPNVGRRLRLWDWTDWPDDAAAVDWEAFIRWWNLGVRTGWATFSELADHVSIAVSIAAEAPDEVRARLLPTPGLQASSTPPPVAREELPMFDFRLATAPERIPIRDDWGTVVAYEKDSWCMRFRDGTRAQTNWSNDTAGKRVPDGWWVKLPDGGVKIVGRGAPSDEPEGRNSMA
jgi:hypothetical protein